MRRFVPGGLNSNRSSIRNWRAEFEFNPRVRSTTAGRRWPRSDTRPVRVDASNFIGPGRQDNWRAWGEIMPQLMMLPKGDTAVMSIRWRMCGLLEEAYGYGPVDSTAPRVLLGHRAVCFLRSTCTASSLYVNAFGMNHTKAVVRSPSGRCRCSTCHQDIVPESPATKSPSSRPLRTSGL